MNPAIIDPHASSTLAGLYLHIPFCKQRCTYCDFYFVTTRTSHVAFENALLTELEHYAPQFETETFDTVYLGGGTPSLLPESSLARIVGAVLDHYHIADDAEFTLEANPEDASLDYLRGVKSLGFNRLSIGVQSFFEEDLQFMNRSHSSGDAAAALEHAEPSGFDNISVDLIFGLPDQPAEHWAAGLQRIVEAGVPHISTYGLTVEERTVLHKQVERGLVQPLSDEEMSDRFLFTMEYLNEHGYEQYEISNFARPGYRSRHNQQYWNHVNYLGMGPSAHSFRRAGRSGSSATRWSNVRNLRQYETLLGSHQLPLEGRQRLTLEDLASEHVMLRLRTSDGLDLRTLESEYGVDLLSEKIDELAWLESEGFIDPIRNSLVRLSLRGRQLCDSVTRKLLPVPSTHARPSSHR